MTVESTVPLVTTEVAPGLATAVVKIYPQGDNAVTLLYNEGVRLRQYAEARVVKTDDDVKDTTNDLSLIARLKKAIEEKRKEYVGPINEHLKAVNKAFQDLTAPLTEADTITRQKVNGYLAEQKRIRAEQEEINRMRIEAARKEMELKGEITESVNLVEVAPPPPKRVYSDTGTLSQRDHWTFEVVDFALLPDEYKLADTTKIGKVVRAGLRNIPGVRIFNEPILAVNPY